MKIDPKYRFILMDADNTLLDFDKTERLALRDLLKEEGIRPTKKLHKAYHIINSDCWKRFERGEITKPQLLVMRFQLFFEQEHLKSKTDNDYQRITDRYTDLLARGHWLLPQTRYLCRKLKKWGCNLYILTNGIEKTQWKRYLGSGLEKYVTDMFVSETIGFPKPDPRYFDYAFSHISGFNKDEAVLYGDSLSSDILGAQNAHIVSVWFNPHVTEANPDILPVYTVKSHKEFLKIIKGNRS